jgi:hypothetical protein
MQKVLEYATPRQMDIEMLKAFVSHLFEEFYSLNALISVFFGVLALLLAFVDAKKGKEKKGFIVYLILNLF